MGVKKYSGRYTTVFSDIALQRFHTIENNIQAISFVSTWVLYVSSFNVSFFLYKKFLLI